MKEANDAAAAAVAVVDVFMPPPACRRRVDINDLCLGVLVREQRKIF